MASAKRWVGGGAYAHPNPGGNSRDLASRRTFGKGTGTLEIPERMPAEIRAARKALVEEMCVALRINVCSPGRYAEIARVSSVGGSQLGVNASHLAGWENGRSGRDNKLCPSEKKALKRQFPQIQFPWDANGHDVPSTAS